MHTEDPIQGRHTRPSAGFGSDSQPRRTPATELRCQLISRARTAAATLDTHLAPGQLALITGPSGSGKSLVVDQLTCTHAAPDSHQAHQHQNRASNYHALQTPHRANNPHPRSTCGLADAQQLVTPAGALSVGQRARLSLALALEAAGLNRQTLHDHRRRVRILHSTARPPHAIAVCIRKQITPPIRLVAATAHDDLIEPLAPDLLIYTPLEGTARTPHKRTRHAAHAPGRLHQNESESDSSQPQHHAPGRSRIGEGNKDVPRLARQASLPRRRTRDHRKDPDRPRRNHRRDRRRARRQQAHTQRQVAPDRLAKQVRHRHQDPARTRHQRRATDHQQRHHRPSLPRAWCRQSHSSARTSTPRSRRAPRPSPRWGRSALSSNAQACDPHRHRTHAPRPPGCSPTSQPARAVSLSTCSRTQSCASPLEHEAAGHGRRAERSDAQHRRWPDRTDRKRRRCQAHRAAHRLRAHRSLNHVSNFERTVPRSTPPAVGAIRLFRSTYPNRPTSCTRGSPSTLSITIPRKPIIAGSSAPFDYLCHTFFEHSSPRDALVWANRGGGKTFLGAVATALDHGVQARHRDPHPRRQPRAGGPDARAPPRALLKSNRPRAARRGQDDRQAPAPHNRFARRTARREPGIRARYARSETPVRRGRSLRSQNLGSGPTRHTLGAVRLGLRPGLHRVPLDHAPALRHDVQTRQGSESGCRQIFKWGVVDVLDDCTDEHECTSDTGTECDLLPECAGSAKTRTEPGHVSVNDALSMKRRVSLPVWNAEMLCLEPRRSDCVYPDFDPKRAHRRCTPTPEIAGSFAHRRHGLRLSRADRHPVGRASRSPGSSPITRRTRRQRGRPRQSHAKGDSPTATTDPRRSGSESTPRDDNAPGRPERATSQVLTQHGLTVKARPSRIAEGITARQRTPETGLG